MSKKIVELYENGMSTNELAKLNDCSIWENEL
jgi:hypothetical protein